MDSAVGAFFFNMGNFTSISKFNYFCDYFLLLFFYCHPAGCWWSSVEPILCLLIHRITFTFPRLLFLWLISLGANNPTKRTSLTPKAAREWMNFCTVSHQTWFTWLFVYLPNALKCVNGNRLWIGSIKPDKMLSSNKKFQN